MVVLLRWRGWSEKKRNGSDADGGNGSDAGGGILTPRWPGIEIVSHGGAAAAELAGAGGHRGVLLCCWAWFGLPQRGNPA